LRQHKGRGKTRTVFFGIVLTDELAEVLNPWQV